MTVTAPGTSITDARALIDRARVCIFDIDGTLLHCRDAVHYWSFTRAFRDVLGIEATIDGVPWHGNTDTAIARAVSERMGVARDVFDRERDRFVHVMNLELTEKTTQLEPELCPSIEILVASLHERGKLIGVATGNIASVGWAKLEAAGLREFIRFGSFSDQTETRVEIFRNAVAMARELVDVANGEIVFFGDTPADIEAAAALGIPIIALATGKYSHKELSQLNPSFCLSCSTALVG